MEFTILYKELFLIFIMLKLKTVVPTISILFLIICASIRHTFGENSKGLSNNDNLE